MANPTVSATLDKSVYTPGDVMTLTVNYSDADTKSVKLTITVEDSQGNVSAPVVVNAVIDQVTVRISDSDRPWTLVSDTGSVAVFQAVA